MTAKDKLVTEAFLTAGRDLGIEVVAPFDVIVDGQTYRFLAFLPHFGGAKGMAVAAGPADSALYRAAQGAGHYVSFINTDLYNTYDQKHFVDTLSDWGYHGPAEGRPAWLKVGGGH